MDTEFEEIIILPEDENSIIMDKFSWDEQMTIALIIEYKKYKNEFNNHLQKKKTIWQQIAQNLIKQGFIAVRTEHCEKKWRNLKKTFKDIYLGDRSRKSKIKWKYYEILEDDFANDPEILKCVNKTNSDITPKRNSFNTNEQIEVMDTAKHSVYGAECVKDNVKEQQPPEWFLIFLQQYKEDEERKIEMLQNMHVEILDLERHKCALLEKIIKTLPLKDGKSDHSLQNKKLKISDNQTFEN